MERFCITLLLLRYFGHFHCAEIKPEYFVVGQTITLRPPDTADITSFLWKHNGDMVAELAKGATEVDYYGEFKGRTTLDPASGKLAITPATEGDAGVYTMEINDKIMDLNYEVKSVQEVPTPKVWVKPGPTEKERGLSCEGDVSKSGPVQFFWNITEDGSFVELGSHVTIENNVTTRAIPSFVCKMVNVGGEKMSESVRNPFYPETPDLSALTALILLLPIGLGAYFGYKKKDVIINRCCAGGQVGDGAGGSAAGQGGSNAAGPAANETEEALPLNGKSVADDQS